MDRVITYNFGENFILELARYIKDVFLKPDKDLSRLAIVFGGKRPALFLKRELARRIGASFFPPKFFSMDEFMSYILAKKISFRLISDLDACYTIYKLAAETAPDILKTKEEFSQFLPWAREIKLFIEEMDLEDVEEESLRNLQVNAEIGYEIPENINTLLKNIIRLRQVYHENLIKRNVYSRGLVYLQAGGLIQELDFSEFDRILLGNFYYLHKTEEKVIKYLYDTGKAILFFQKDERDWPALSRLARKFSCKLEPESKISKKVKISILKGFDIHSQVGLARQILKGVERPEETVIVLPEATSLIPLVSEIADCVKEFNVSLGYPLKRSTLYSLFNFIFKAQATRKGSAYYTKDYLKVLMHPLIKNLMLLPEPSVTRVLVHKIEEILLGMEKTKLGGTLFIELDEVEDLQELYLLVISTLNQMDIPVTESKLREVLKDLHQIGFRFWEEICNFAQFSKTLEEFLNLLVKKSFLKNYLLNLKVVEKIHALKDELSSVEFSQQKFPRDEIYKIFSNRIENEMISFSGSPLKGLQVLGLFETRALNFENVIVLDTNESVLPKLRVYEPLIPRQIMISLGLNRLEQEEEIQRYHFMRLISGAKNAYLIYDDSSEKVKSRFIEEIIWERQKEEKRLDVFIQKRACFNVEVLPKKGRVKKSLKIIESLRESSYSPSSLDTYLNCPLQFYYQYVLKLQPREDFLSRFEGRDIGNFIHELLEETFIEFINKRPRFDTKFQKKFFKKFEEKFDQIFSKRIGSEAFMVKQIMEYRLKRFLEQEKQRKIRKIISLEDESLGGKIKLACGTFEFKSKIDRIDELEDGTLLIIDYKTGGGIFAPQGLNKLTTSQITRESIKKTIKSFQLPLYFYFVRERFKNRVINAVLYNLRDLEMLPLFKDLSPESIEGVINISLKSLEVIIAEILNPEIDFEADESQSRICQSCSFFYLCR